MIKNPVRKKSRKEICENDLKEEISRLKNQVHEMSNYFTLGRTTASIIHDINNPLSVVTGYCQILLMSKEKRKVSERKMLETIEKEAERCRELVRNLLDSYGKANKDEKIRINDVIEDALELMKPGGFSQDIEVKRKYCDSIPEIYGIKSEFQQVFTNLMINAVESMPGGGELTIETKYCRSNGNKSAEVIISDTGSGINRENLGRVFKPFFTTKKKGKKGSGIGLSMSRIIIDNRLSGKSEQKKRIDDKDL